MAAYGGCFWYPAHLTQPSYLPQVSLKAHATVLYSAARTTLTQTFVNPTDKLIEEASYTFPLYDGVSIVGFECKVGARILHSKVKSKSQANEEYKSAVTKKRVAAIMDHTSQNDVFVIRLGNIPANEKVNVDITFVEELKQDSQTDGIRYTLPNVIAPRYGNQEAYRESNLPSFGITPNLRGMSITVDVIMDQSMKIRELESPSHRVKVSLGQISTTSPTESTFEPSRASASLTPRGDNKKVWLEKDFVILIKVDGLDSPCALLETHPTIPNQRALMATLVPKFDLQPSSPEVVFVVDRSASMSDKIPTLQSALKVFLKSLPVGVCFNLCSFGSNYSFLWPTSNVYDALSLEEALSFVDTVYANCGGTELERAVIATVGNRLKDKDLEVLILTDGQIYNQQSLFNFVRQSAVFKDARFFSFGIGDATSHSLIEGIARAGNGFSQSVMQYEELDRKVVRMLKGALTPHIYDYKLEVEYEAESGFEFVSTQLSDYEIDFTDDDRDSTTEEATGHSQQPIPLFDENLQEPDIGVDTGEKLKTAELPSVTPPKAIQAPYRITSLYPFIRTNVYLLMDPKAPEKTPKSIKFNATSKQGPLNLRIPIYDIGHGETIHQLASRKAVVELEEEHGWLSHAKDNKGNSFKDLHLITRQRLAERECQSLGIKFQVTGKYCSFVALEEPSTRAGQRGRQNTPKEHVVECVSPDLATPVGNPSASIVANAMFFGARSMICSTRSPQQLPTAPSIQRHSRIMACSQRRASLNMSLSAAQAPVVASQASSLMGEVQDPSARIYEIIALQTSEGSWMMSDRLFELLKCDRKETTRNVADLFARDYGMVPDNFPHGDQATVVATLLTMGYLERKEPVSRGLWELVYNKANLWVTNKLAEMKARGEFQGGVLESIWERVARAMVDSPAFL